jgi:hypothetical protein
MPPARLARKRLHVLKLAICGLPDQIILKMKIDPDELLKTKGKFGPKRVDPDGRQKTKELRDN